MGSTGVPNVEVVEAYLSSDWDRRTRTLGSLSTWASVSAAWVSEEGIMRTS